MSAAKTPEERFHEAAELARNYFAGDGPAKDEVAFAEAYGWTPWNSGGGCMVALLKLSTRHVLCVTVECTCLYETEVPEGEEATADALFAYAEDPWLVEYNCPEDDPRFTADDVGKSDGLGA